MNTPKDLPKPPQPRHEEERAHKKTEHEEEQPRATDEAGQVRANVSPLFCAPAESNPRSDRNRQAHEPGRASARGAASLSAPRSGEGREPYRASSRRGASLSEPRPLGWWLG